MGHSRNIFPCIRPFSAWRQPNNQPTEQRGDPSASACLLLMSEKAVLCNILLSFLHRKTCAKDGDNDDHVHGTGGGGNDEKQ